MFTILATMSLAVLAGIMAGGRLSHLAALRIRWLPAAIVGFALQIAPVSGRTLPLALLWISFGLLAAFAAANVRLGLPGFRLVLAGVLLNFTVIALNAGMPVSEEALARSGQLDTIPALVDGGEVKHHLAGPGDRLLLLGDVIPVAPFREVVSVGDVLTYAGVAWLLARATLGRRGRGAEDLGSRAGRLEEAVGV
jgi:hypothetical protein